MTSLDGQVDTMTERGALLCPTLTLCPGSNPSSRVEMLRCWLSVKKRDVPQCPFPRPGLCVDELDFQPSNPAQMSAGNQALFRCREAGGVRVDVFSAVRTILVESSSSEYIFTSWNWSWQETIRRHSLIFYSLNK